MKYTTPSLDNLVADTRRAIEETALAFGGKWGVAFSGGKDSTALLHMALPYRPKALFLDTGHKHKETHEYIWSLANDWDFTLYSILQTGASDCGMECKEWKALRATEAPKWLGWRALLVATRKDEHDARADEKTHRTVNGIMRVHPMLAWTEMDVWEYISKNNIPWNELYDEGYRSIGCAPLTHPSDESERDGREWDSFEAMKRLRALGYF